MAGYVEVPYQHSLEKLESGEYTHAAHAMLYAPWPGALFDKYEHKYAVMVSSCAVMSARCVMVLICLYSGLNLFVHQQY